MKKSLLIISLVIINYPCYCWGFFGHQKINSYTVFLLPPDMKVLYKPNIIFLSDHAVDSDKKRYAVADETTTHYNDIDHFGKYPYDSLPRKWNDVIARFCFISLQACGVEPWYVQTMLTRLTKVFKEKDFSKLMKNSAALGHDIAGTHVPLHANNQKIKQKNSDFLINYFLPIIQNFLAGSFVTFAPHKLSDQ